MSDDPTTTRNASTDDLDDLEARRQHQRVSPDWLQCDVGDILDISLGGAMVQSKKRLKGNLAVRIWDASQGLILQAKVVWSNPVCFRHHEIGLQWQNLGAKNAETLEELLFPFGKPDENDAASDSPDLRLIEEDGTEVVPSTEGEPGSGEDEMLSIDDAQLRFLVDAWPHLPKPLQEGIVRLAKGA